MINVSYSQTLYNSTLNIYFLAHNKLYLYYSDIPRTSVRCVQSSFFKSASETLFIKSWQVLFILFCPSPWAYGVHGELYHIYLLSQQVFIRNTV